MSGAEFVWGLVGVGTGIFISVYGNMLFRFTLAAMGFGAGFFGVYLLLDGQSETVQVLVALAAGGIGAVLFYSLIMFGLYIAGAILGAVLSLVLGAIISIFGPDPSTFLWYILVIAGVGLGGFFGPRLGNLIIILATAAAGAYLTVYGIHVWFASRLTEDLTSPQETIAQKLSLIMFLVVALIGGLSQYNSSRLRARLLH